MGPDGDYQPLQPNGNGKQLSQFSPLYATGYSEVGEEKFELRQLLAVARRRLLIIAGVAIAVSSGVAAKILKQVPNYEGRFQLLIGSASGDKVDKLTQSLSQGAGFQVEGPDYETQIQVLWSHQVMSPIVKKINARYPDIDYNTLRSKLAITRLGTTKILEVSYQDSDPEKIKFILDRLADGYVTYSQTEQRASLKQGLSFVNKQASKLQDRVKDLQNSIQYLRENYKIVDPETQGQLLTSRVSAIVQQRQETQSQLGEAKKLQAELQGQLAQLGVTPEESLTASALSEAPRYQQLLNQLSDIESKIAKESARFTEDSPTIQALREQQQNLLPLLNQEVTTVVGNEGSDVPTDPESLASPNSIRSTLTQKLVETTNQIQVLEVRRNSIAEAEGLLGKQLKGLAD